MWTGRKFCGVCLCVAQTGLLESGRLVKGSCSVYVFTVRAFVGG